MNEASASEAPTEILCTLHPLSPAAHEVITRLLCLDPSSLLRLSPHKHPRAHDIALRTTPGPRRPQMGFTFGRHASKCDVNLGDSRRVSGVHFRIYARSPGVVVLQDCSTNGTWVDQVKLEGGAWKALVDGGVVTVAPGRGVVRFGVRLRGRAGLRGLLEIERILRRGWVEGKGIGGEGGGRWDGKGSGDVEVTGWEVEKL